jgi:PqqD family protein of HPr-rel-A system
MRVRGAPSEALRIVQLDDLTTIYDRRSGQTHIVAVPVPAILAAISGEIDAQGLLVALGVADDAGAHELIVERLEELIATGLVERL